MYVYICRYIYIYIYIYMCLYIYLSNSQPECRNSSGYDAALEERDAMHARVAWTASKVDARLPTPERKAVYT